MKKLILILLFPLFAFGFELGVKVGSTGLNFQNRTEYINGTSDIYLNKYLFGYKRNVVGFSFDFIYGKDLELNNRHFYRSFEANAIVVVNLVSDIGTPEIFILSNYVNPNKKEEGRIDSYFGLGLSANRVEINQKIYKGSAYQYFFGIRWMYIERLGIGFEYRFKNFKKNDLNSVENFFFNVVAAF